MTLVRPRRPKATALLASAVLPLALAGPSIGASIGTPGAGVAASQIAATDAPSLPVRGYLYGVEAIADDDVWVIGDTEPRFGRSHAIVRHWDGAAWSRPACATGPHSTYTAFEAVAATGPDDVWLAGTVGTFTSDGVPLLVHWDGSTCQRVRAPKPPGLDIISDVEAFAPDDVVVAGDVRAADGSTRVVLLRWDGARWARLPGPPRTAGTSTSLADLAGTASTDLWVSVQEDDRATGAATGVLLHRVGSASGPRQSRPVGG